MYSISVSMRGLCTCTLSRRVYVAWRPAGSGRQIGLGQAMTDAGPEAGLFCYRRTEAYRRRRRFSSSDAMSAGVGLMPGLPRLRRRRTRGRGDGGRPAMTATRTGLWGSPSNDDRTTSAMLNGLCVICAAISATGHRRQDALVDTASPPARLDSVSFELNKSNNNNNNNNNHDNVYGAVIMT